MLKGEVGRMFLQGAWLIDFEFPSEYPFKPPKVSFKTKIYHPNVDEKGQVHDIGALDTDSSQCQVICHEFCLFRID